MPLCCDGEEDDGVFSSEAEVCCEFTSVSAECDVSDESDVSDAEAFSGGVPVSGIEKFSSLYVPSCSDESVSPDGINACSLSAVRLLPAAIKKQSSRQIDIFKFSYIFMLLNSLPFEDIVFP